MNGRIFLLIFFLTCTSGNSIFAEEEKISLEAIKKVVKEAIKEVQTEEEQQQEQFAAELKIKLDSVAAEWIAIEKKLRAKDLNQLLRERWEMLKKRTTPIPYEYYLRDYAYFVTKEDVSQTGSVIVPFRGLIEIVEERYIERYHSPDAANIKDYLHTVVRQVQIAAEYRGDKFVITDIKEGQTYMVSGWQKRNE